jgi:hypothetical protein
MPRSPGRTRRVQRRTPPPHTPSPIRQTRCDIPIGMRYYFQPRMCMLPRRHSGLLNFLNRTPDHLQVRLEGLRIG